MYPHTTAPSRTNAGPCQPKLVLSMMRLSGSASAVNGMRITRLVSPGSIALTGDGVRQWASTPVTSNRDGGMCRRGSRISGSTPAGSTPVSSAASRIAVAGGPASPSLTRAAGKRDLAGVVAEVGRPLLQQDVRPVVTVGRDQDQDRCLPLGGRVRYGIVAAQLFRASRGNRVDKARERRWHDG